MKELRNLDPVILTKCLIKFNNIVREEICIKDSTLTPAEEKWETALSEQYLRLLGKTGTQPTQN